MLYPAIANIVSILVACETGCMIVESVIVSDVPFPLISCHYLDKASNRRT